MSSTGIHVKGSGVRGAVQWIERRFGGPSLEVILAKMPPELRDDARHALPSSWYPIDIWNHLLDGAATLSELKDRDQLGQFFITAGSDVAREHLSTFYKLMLALMTPDRLFDRLPRIWGTYFRGMEVTIAPAASPKSGRMTVRGFRRTPYMAPVASGWLKYAYEKVGGELTISEESWDRGVIRADPLVFVFSWR